MLDNFRFYRRLRGGVWVKYFDKATNGGTEYWIRYNFASDAFHSNKEFNMMGLKAIAFEYYDGVVSISDTIALVHLSKLIGHDVSLISDGYHTFGELYEHRNRLFINIVNIFHESKFRNTWKSRKNSDGSFSEGWFVAGIGDRITYHIPEKYWNRVNCQEIEKGLWDGHTSDVVLDRILNLYELGNHTVKIGKIEG